MSCHCRKHYDETSTHRAKPQTKKLLPKLTVMDQFLLGFCSLFLHPSRVIKTAIILKPSTLLKLHNALIQRKYRLLYTSTKSSGKPGLKGPSTKLINAIVEMKQRNPRFGCPRIAQQISLAFSIEINKNVVRRILVAHYDDWNIVQGRILDVLFIPCLQLPTVSHHDAKWENV